MKRIFAIFTVLLIFAGTAAFAGGASGKETGGASAAAQTPSLMDYFGMEERAVYVYERDYSDALAEAFSELPTVNKTITRTITEVKKISDTETRVTFKNQDPDLDKEELLVYDVGPDSVRLSKLSDIDTATSGLKRTINAETIGLDHIILKTPPQSWTEKGNITYAYKATQTGITVRGIEYDDCICVERTRKEGNVTRVECNYYAKGVGLVLTYRIGIGVWLERSPTIELVEIKRD